MSTKDLKDEATNLRRCQCGGAPVIVKHRGKYSITCQECMAHPSGWLTQVDGIADSQMQRRLGSMGSKQEEREPRYCRTCGIKLVRQYYYMGYCRLHHRVGDAKLVQDAKAAKEHGLSYGNYMAAKREGRLR